MKTRRTKRTKFEVSGAQVPAWLVTALRKKYGADVVEVVTDSDDETLVDSSSSEWYRERSATMSPGKRMRLYRENRGFTQEALAEKLGDGVKKQHVSNMENGSRPISVATAKRLAEIFSCPPARFVFPEA